MGIKNPLVLKTFLINSKNQFSEDEYHKMLRKVDAIPTEKDDSERKQYLFHGIRRDITNGFAPQSISKLENVILFFINRFDGVFYTMMNKLLFYADFYSYKTRGIGLTGLSYVAIQRGPVPVRWDRIYSFFDDIRPEIVHFGNGVEGTKLKADVDFNKALFSEEESGILEKVYERFSEVNASQISETSHDEEAWQQFVGKKEPVDYSMAFSLKAM